MLLKTFIHQSNPCYFLLISFPTLCVYTICKHQISHNQAIYLFSMASQFHYILSMIIMFPYLPKTHHDNATLYHNDIINSGLFHTLITSYIQTNICLFIYSTWLSKHYQKHTHQSQIYILIYIHSPIKVILALKHT